MTGGAGPSGHLSAKRGTEDLDYFIGDEALAQAAGPGMLGLEGGGEELEKLQEADGMVGE